MPKIIKIGQFIKSYLQIKLNNLQINDCTSHAAIRLFTLTRHQAARGAMG